MIKIASFEISEIDKQGDFEILFSDCYACGVQRYTYISEEEAHTLMYFLKKQLVKHDKKTNQND